MNKKKLFLEIFKKAEKKYGKIDKRLAGEGWNSGWKTLIVTIMSAQSRDEMTIKIGEELFRKYGNLENLANAKNNDVLRIFKSLNYNKTKAKNVIGCAKMLVEDYNSNVPEKIDDLVKLPGVGRKTANLIITEVHGLDGICVDTHVHRICNVFGIVNTKNANETEMELRKIVPRKYWYRINRIFVLWGKDCPGNDKERLLKKLEEKS
jgi:endonuclease III